MNGELAGIMSEAAEIAAYAQETFGHLSPAQLRWKPSPGEWSVAQCLDHLVRIDSGYFPAFLKIERGEHEPTLYQRLPLLPALFARLVMYGVRPEATRKFRTAPKFEPSASVVGGDVLARFLAHQQEVLGHMKKTQHLDPTKVVLASPVASVVTYRLLDAFRILVTHERRHLAQARRVMEREGFPEVRTGGVVSR